MADKQSGRIARFWEQIIRKASSQRLRQEDEESIRHTPPSVRTRREEPIRLFGGIDIGEQTRNAKQNFMERGYDGHHVPVYASKEEGLRHNGWAEIPLGGVRIGTGSFGSLHLGYKLSEAGVELEARHLCAIKVQPQSIPNETDIEEGYNYQVLWNEIEILRGLVHENIIDYYAHFAVDEGHRLQIYLLLEYANAGDLAKEVQRYPETVIDEPGSRYYMLQICRGIGYMHSKHVVHADLHSGNILLKYNRDGSKTCLICDFGVSEAWRESQLERKDQYGLVFNQTTRRDVFKLCLIAHFMMWGEHPGARSHRLSQEAIELLKVTRPNELDRPQTVNELMERFTWFNGPVAAPFPKPPTPNPERRQIQAMGYLVPRQPSPGWSKKEIEARRKNRSQSPAAASTSQESASQQRSSTSRSRHPSPRATAAPSHRGSGSQLLPHHPPADVAPTPQNLRPTLRRRMKSSWESFTNFVSRPFRRRHQDGHETLVEEDPAPTDARTRRAVPRS